MFQNKLKQMAVVFGIMLTGIFVLPEDINASCTLRCEEATFYCPDGRDCYVINGELYCEGAPAGNVNCDNWGGEKDAGQDDPSEN